MDIDSLHSFISPEFATKIRRFSTPRPYALVVVIPSSGVLMSNQDIKSCPLNFDNYVLVVDL